MEIIFFLLIVGAWIFIKFLFNSYRESHPNSQISNIGVAPMLTSIKCTTISIGDNNETAVFQPKLCGPLKNTYTRNISFFVNLLDVTEDEVPVICAIPHFQYEDSVMFFYQSPYEEISYTNAEFKDFVTLINIPIESLVFPKKGKRKLKFEVGVQDTNGTILNSATETITYENTNKGYIENREEIEEVEGLVLKLAIYVSGVDQEFNENEVAIINKYIDVKSKLNDGSNNSEKKAKFKKIIKETIIELRRTPNNFSLIQLTNLIHEKADVAIKYEAIEMLLKIVAVDGTYSKEEYSAINTIADKIGLNLEKVRAMSEKIVPVSIFEEEPEFDKLLGLNASMTIEEKKKHLREEYRKWNQRVTSSDLKIRHQATKMLEIIAQERAKL